jgi:hypothetical protein
MCKWSNICHPDFLIPQGNMGIADHEKVMEKSHVGKIEKSWCRLKLRPIQHERDWKQAIFLLRFLSWIFAIQLKPSAIVTYRAVLWALERLVSWGRRPRDLRSYFYFAPFASVAAVAGLRVTFPSLSGWWWRVCAWWLIGRSVQTFGVFFVRWQVILHRFRAKTGYEIRHIIKVIHCDEQRCLFTFTMTMTLLCYWYSDCEVVREVMWCRYD